MWLGSAHCYWKQRAGGALCEEPRYYISGCLKFKVYWRK